MPHRRLEGCPLFCLPPSERLSRRACSSASFWAKTSYASSIVSAPPWRTRVFLALRCLLSALFAARSVRTSANKRVISWANISIPLANAAIVSKIGVRELPWWRVIRLFTKVDYKSVLIALWGVWETQGFVLVEGGVLGFGVLNLILSFEITACGLKGTKPAPRNPAWLF